MEYLLTGQRAEQAFFVGSSSFYIGMLTKHPAQLDLSELEQDAMAELHSTACSTELLGQELEKQNNLPKLEGIALHTEQIELEQPALQTEKIELGRSALHTEQIELDKSALHTEKIELEHTALKMNQDSLPSQPDEGRRAFAASGKEHSGNQLQGKELVDILAFPLLDSKQGASGQSASANSSSANSGIRTYKILPRMIFLFIILILTFFNQSSLSFSFIQNCFKTTWDRELDVQADLLTSFGQKELEKNDELTSNDWKEESELYKPLGRKELVEQLVVTQKLWKELAEQLAGKLFRDDQLQQILSELEENKKQLTKAKLHSKPSDKNENTELEQNLVTQQFYQKNFEKEIFKKKLAALLLEWHFAKAASYQLCGRRVWEKYREASEDSFDKVGDKELLQEELRRQELGCKDLWPAYLWALCPTSFEENSFTEETFANTSLDKETFTESSLPPSSFTESSLTQSSLTENSFSENTFLKNSFSEKSFDKKSFAKKSFDKKGFAKKSFDKKGFAKKSFDKKGFAKKTFDKSSFDKQSFDKSSFGKSSFGRSSLEESSLDQSSFANSSSEESSFSKSSLEDSSLEKSSLQPSSLANSSLKESSLKEKSFAESSFKKSSFSQSNFEDSSFSTSSLEESSFTSSFEQSSLQLDSFDHSFGNSSFRSNSFQQRSFTNHSFQKDSLQASSLTDSFQRPRASTELAELQQLDQPAFRTEQRALKKELEELRAQLCQEASPWWPQAEDRLGPRGSARGKLPTFQLTSLTDRLCLHHMGAQACLTCTLAPPPKKKAHPRSNQAKSKFWHLSAGTHETPYLAKVPWTASNIGTLSSGGISGVGVALFGGRAFSGMGPPRYMSSS